MTGIGTLNEGPLHAALKELYRQAGDQVELPVDGFVADLFRNGTLIEIQTRGFSSMRNKFDRLLDNYSIHLVHPIAINKWIIKLDSDGGELSRRKSPKEGTAVQVCEELVSFPSLLTHPNFTLEVVLIEEEEVWRPDPKGRRKRGFITHERRLLNVLETIQFDSSEDLLQLLPAGLPSTFTTKDLAKAMGKTKHLAQQFAYCLRLSEAVETVGRDKTGILYKKP